MAEKENNETPGSMASKYTSWVPGTPKISPDDPMLVNPLTDLWGGSPHSDGKPTVDPRISNDHKSPL